MFGLGFGEMIVLGVVLLVVVGPKELPKLLRALGQGIRKLRGLSSDLRAQSGIDEIIRDEGLRDDLDALRSISRGRVVDSLMRDGARPRSRPRGPQRVALEDLNRPEGTPPPREQEYPLIGPDSYDALPEDAEPYGETKSAAAALSTAAPSTAAPSTAYPKPKPKPVEPKAAAEPKPAPSGELP